MPSFGNFFFFFAEMDKMTQIKQFCQSHTTLFLPLVLLCLSHTQYAVGVHNMCCVCVCVSEPVSVLCELAVLIMWADGRLVY